MKRLFFGLVIALTLAFAGGAAYTSAAPSGPPHGAGRGAGGQVTAIDGTTITVKNPKGTETIATTSSTTFQLDGASSSLSAITVGMFVRAEGSKATDGSFTATSVNASTSAPKGGKPGQGHPGNGVGGQVTAIDGTTITVKNPKGTETIATTSSTTFQLDGASSSLSAITVGMFVRAEGSKAADGSFTATSVNASTSAPQAGKPGQGHPGNRAGGQVTAIDGTTITVKNPRGTETIATTSSTTFQLDGASSSLSAITIGMFVRAEGSKAADGSFTATSVNASTSAPQAGKPGQGHPGNGAGGQVTAIDGTTITVKNPRGTETIATTSSTTFQLDGASSSLSAITVGMFVRAEGSKATDGSFTATSVNASTSAPKARPRR